MPCLPPGAQVYNDIQMTNPDNFTFTARCPYCNESHDDVLCSRSQAATGELIAVGSLTCGKTWHLSPEDSKKLREDLSRPPWG